MTLQDFLDTVLTDPESIEFTDTIAIIESNYDFTASNFSNGEQYNNAGENEGSCKILAFALLNKLTEKQTLHCFGQYYREEVLDDPEGESHQNIRQFIQHGFDGIKFEKEVLRRRS